MRRIAIVLASWIASACSTGATSRREPVPDAERPLAEALDSLPPQPAALDLSGTWTTGSAGEPTVPRIVFALQCNHTPAYLAIEQRADTVRAWAIPASQAQGIRAPEPITSSRPIEGRMSGLRVTMGSGTSRYVLQYDSTSGHLRGTLGAQPFWAVRLQLIRPTGCIAVP
jgi:hypothetical protein